MYKIYKYINNIKHSFKIIDSFVCYNTNNDEVIVRDFENDKNIFIVKEKTGSIGAVFNQFYYNNNNNSFSQIIDLEFKKTKVTNYLITNSNENILLGKIRKEKTNKVLLVDENFNVLWSIELKMGNQKLVSPEQIFFTEFLNNKTIHKIALKTGNPIWTYDLSDLGAIAGKPYEVRKFIGVWQQQLLVSCANNAIIAIDTQSGKLIKQWYAFEPLIYDNYSLNHIPYAWSTMLDDERDIVIGFGFFVCWIINLKTHQMEVIDLGATLIENNLRKVKWFTGFAMSKTHYFMTAESPVNEELNRKYENLIAINKNTLQIDWKYQFPNYMALGVNVPQYANNKLYQLDWDNTLHIFEKQEEENILPVR